MAVFSVAIAVLWSVLGSSDVSASEASAPDLAAAQGIYLSRCAFCHGEKGGGDGIAGGGLQPPASDFTSALFWKGKTAALVRSGIVDGKSGTAMMGFGSTLQPEEIDSLVKVLEGFKPTE
jgi:high-affinity iron transporter